VQGPPRHPGPPLSLAKVRLGLGKTQVELAARMGISQSDYSKLERRGDLRLSTLAELARALGGRLRLVLSLRDRDQEIKVGTHPRERQPAERVRLVPKDGTRSTR
jgi:transcriptional regulator with XRE-family HTH domain